MPRQPPVTIHPPHNGGGRRVTIRGEPAGIARHLDDVLEFLRRAGLDDPDLHDPGLIDWRGGGPRDWT